MRERDRKRVERRLAAKRQEIEDLEALVAAEAELADAHAYADRLAKVLALRDYGACLGPAGDRCHHGVTVYPELAIPAQRQPPLVDVIGKRAERRAGRKRDARREARDQAVTEDP